jgi:uncharacterized protein
MRSVPSSHTPNNNATTPVPSAPFYRYKRFMIDQYGEPVYRVPIDAGFGCPNRQSVSGRGCTFCPADGSRAHQTAAGTTLEEQVALGIAFARRRYGARRFMAYVQAFTGTFAPIDVQRRLHERILAAHPFEAISIGTRPDCLSGDTLELLGKLNDRLEVWVELGIQTVHDETLQRINRGHDWQTAEAAILALVKYGLKVAVHVILGLPGETEAHFERTATTLRALPIDGIKIHNLHVVKETALAEEYLTSPFPLFDEQEYAAVLAAFLRRLPARWPVMRLCTDTPPGELIAPRWSLSKTQFLSYLEQLMLRNGWRQGELCNEPFPQ